MNTYKKIILIFLLFSVVLGIWSFLFLKSLTAFAVVFLLAVVFIAAPILYIHKKEVEIIKKISFKMEEVSAGNMSRLKKSARKDEVGQAVNALNDLITRLKTKVAIDVTKEREINRAKTDFISLASHQLRTPLSIIKWYIDFIVSGDAGDLSQEQSKYLKEVYKANERLIELVNNLLDVSRIDLGTFSVEPEPTDLIKIVEKALLGLRRSIEEKKLIIEKKYDELADLNLDSKLMQIVFENLLTNAIKYTPEDGKVSIEIKKTDQDVFIKIADTGCGIPRDQQPKIFTKLFRADNVRRLESIGTGLGLYIVKAVIEKSGGKIWFESPNMDYVLSQDHKKIAKASKEMLGTVMYISIPAKGMLKIKGSKKLT